MNPKELGIIKHTAEGIRRALDQLSSDQSDEFLSSAVCDFMQRYDRPLSSADAGYYATMYLAWKERGCPDVLT